MLNTHPRLTLDVAFGVKFTDMEYVNIEKYMDKLRSHVKWAYKVTEIRET